MAKLDLEAIQARVAAQTGVADPLAASKVRPGAVFEIDDKLIRFPGDSPRTWHDFRRVIVVQGYSFCGQVLPSTVSVVPCSASRNKLSREGASGPDVRRGEFLVPEGEPAFTKPDVIALAPLLMPVLKKALTSEGYRGDLRPETYGKLIATIRANLGLNAEVMLPPRQ